MQVTSVVETLPNSRIGSHIAGELIRSGTSPAPNYGEARRDFVHKMKIALKELRETLIWLKIIERKEFCDPRQVMTSIKECDELISIFVSSVKTVESNRS